MKDFLLSQDLNSFKIIDYFIFSVILVMESKGTVRGSEGLIPRLGLGNIEYQKGVRGLAPSVRVR